MTGQMWQVPAEGGYLYSDELSDILRVKVQPLTKFRQFCDAEDGSGKGVHAGETFTWNIISDVARQGRRLSEGLPMPETNVTISQASLTVGEWGNSIPYTGKLETLSKQSIVKIIDKALKNDARKCYDTESFLQFNDTLLHAVPTSGTSTTLLTLTENGTTVTTNNVEMGLGHIKTMSDTMKERNIPAFDNDAYYCISHPSTFRTFKNSLEDVHKYTESGLTMIRHGEIGRYEDFRFVEQNHIPKGGAEDSTTFDAWDVTADAWNNAKSSWAFFFGADTVTEAIVLPEEIRAKIPGDYGRSRGIGWYGLGGFKIVHGTAANSRIVKWSSAA